MQVMRLKFLYQEIVLLLASYSFLSKQQNNMYDLAKEEIHRRTNVSVEQRGHAREKENQVLTEVH